MNVQIQMVGGDTIEDAVYKAITKVRVIAMRNPDEVVGHPDTLTHLWPSGVPERLWGMAVVTEDDAPEGELLVRDKARFGQLKRLEARGIDPARVSGLPDPACKVVLS